MQSPPVSRYRNNHNCKRIPDASQARLFDRKCGQVVPPDFINHEIVFLRYNAIISVHNFSYSQDISHQEQIYGNQGAATDDAEEPKDPSPSGPISQYPSENWPKAWSDIRSTQHNPNI